MTSRVSVFLEYHLSVAGRKNAMLHGYDYDYVHYREIIYGDDMWADAVRLSSRRFLNGSMRSCVVIDGMYDRLLTPKEVISIAEKQAQETINKPSLFARVASMVFGVKRTSLVSLLLLTGCELTRPADNRDDLGKPEPIVFESFDRAAASEALARLAERCGKNESRRATVELDGTLNELAVDGAPSDYIGRVRVAVPSIGGKPARDLDAGEIASLRGAR